MAAVRSGCYIDEVLIDLGERTTPAAETDTEVRREPIDQAAK
jgi:hypothetical protein